LLATGAAALDEVCAWSGGTQTPAIIAAASATNASRVEICRILEHTSFLNFVLLDLNGLRFRPDVPPPEPALAAKVVSRFARSAAVGFGVAGATPMSCVAAYNREVRVARWSRLGPLLVCVAVQAGITR
jgi:hypothetical protein